MNDWSVGTLSGAAYVCENAEILGGKCTARYLMSD